MPRPMLVSLHFFLIDAQATEAFAERSVELSFESAMGRDVGHVATKMGRFGGVPLILEVFLCIFCCHERNKF